MSFAAVSTSTWQLLLVLRLGSNNNYEPSFSVQFQLIPDFEAEARECYGWSHVVFEGFLGDAWSISHRLCHEET